jgi:hypothetical protein
MDLNSGRVITRPRITEIPVTPIVINAVETMAKCQGFKSLKFANQNRIIFTPADWIAGVDYEEDKAFEDEDYIQEDNNDEDDDE